MLFSKNPKKKSVLNQRMVTLTMADDEHKESDPFAEYLWMGEMEEFDREIEAEIEEEFHEEQFIMSCIEQLLDEEEEQTVYYQHNQNHGEAYTEVYPPYINNFTEHGYQLQNSPHYYYNDQQLTSDINNMYITSSPYEAEYLYHNSYVQETPTAILKKSTLNPNAAVFTMNPNAQEFVPKEIKACAYPSTLEQDHLSEDHAKIDAPPNSCANY
ncbi:uncharacterized protein LOC100202553 isoform X1 [Hydra vulgaris]|uniref:uncharacterized protein LOC100202553 isoform X1 n=1 Tax=Hydra vulgaris TaxID=6087 RepID=UPI000640C2D8|nr:uncharacterized protein LOC100202553 [Hydra vulgaris]